MLSIIAKEPRRSAAGELYDYNNSNYFLIAQPLGMNDTRFHDDYTEVVPGMATSSAIPAAC